MFMFRHEGNLPLIHRWLTVSSQHPRFFSSLPATIDFPPTSTRENFAYSLSWILIIERLYLLIVLESLGQRELLFYFLNLASQTPT